jgi:hypothetical protein
VLLLYENGGPKYINEMILRSEKVAECRHGSAMVIQTFSLRFSDGTTQRYDEEMIEQPVEILQSSCNFCPRLSFVHGVEMMGKSWRLSSFYIMQ